MAGIDLHTIGTVLGHRDPKSTRRYAHLSRPHTAAAVARLAERLTPPETPAAAPAVAVAGAERAPASPLNVERNQRAADPAKREYLRGHRVGVRRGNRTPDDGD